MLRTQPKPPPCKCGGVCKTCRYGLELAAVPKGMDVPALLAVDWPDLGVLAGVA